MITWTPEELAAMAAADAEIDALPMTPDDYRMSRSLDLAAADDRRDNQAKKIAAKQRAYYEANREEIAARQRAYREANREEYNTYMREYRQKRKEREAHHAPQNPGAANQKPD